MPPQFWKAARVFRPPQSSDKSQNPQNSKSKEFLAQRVLVFRFRGLDDATRFVLVEMRLLPCVDFSDRVADRSERLFLANGSNPGLHRVLVIGLQLVEFGMFAAHVIPAK